MTQTHIETSAMRFRSVGSCGWKRVPVVFTGVQNMNSAMKNATNKKVERLRLPKVLSPKNYVAVVNCAEAFENASLMPFAKLFIAVTANRLISTTRSPYSTRSWPSSSLQSLLRSMVVPFLRGFNTVPQLAFAGPIANSLIVRTIAVEGVTVCAPISLNRGSK